MDKNLNFRDTHTMPSITVQSVATAKAHGLATPSEDVSETEKLKQLEGKVNIVSLSFGQKVGVFGLRTVLKSYVVRYRYILGLWLLRESAIITILSQNYEKVQGLWSRILAKPAVSSRLVIILKRLSGTLLRDPSITKLSVKARMVNSSLHTN